MTPKGQLKCIVKFLKILLGNNATDKALAGEMTVGETIVVTLVSICIMYPVFMLGYYIGLNSKHKDK